MFDSEAKNISNRTVQDKLSFIQNSYRTGAYDVVVKECCSLFEVVFKKIFSEAVTTLPYIERMQLIEFEKQIGKQKKGVQEFGLGELVGLFRESDLMKKWADYTGKDIGLIDTLNYNSIVKLRNKLVHDGEECSQVEADLVFNYLKNMLASLGFINLEKAITESFEKHNYQQHPSQNQNDQDKANIKLIKERGIIINQADGSRNISFKVDTINMLFEVMYKRVKEMVNEESANKVLYEMGYESGTRFGRVMNQKWEVEDNKILYEDKVSKWCEFDSEVGWGKFSSNLCVNTDEGLIDGTLDITENFLCCNRRKNDIKLCSFLKGYCDGVLEELLNGVSVKIECLNTQCPQKNAFKKTCTFKVNI